MQQYNVSKEMLWIWTRNTMFMLDSRRRSVDTFVAKGVQFRGLQVPFLY